MEIRCYNLGSSAVFRGPSGRSEKTREESDSSHGQKSLEEATAELRTGPRGGVREYQLLLMGPLEVKTCLAKLTLRKINWTRISEERLNSLEAYRTGV